MILNIEIGSLVRHNLSERGMTGVLVDYHQFSGNPIVLWYDGRKGIVLRKYLSRVPTWG